MIIIIILFIIIITYYNDYDYNSLNFKVFNRDREAGREGGKIKVRKKLYY